MRNRWKRLAVVFGAAVLVVCQNGIIEVKAAQLPENVEEGVQAAGPETEGTAGEDAEEEVGEEIQAASPETEETAGEDAEEEIGEEIQAEPQSEDVNENQKAGSLLKAEELRWRHEVRTGFATFKIPNEKGTALYKVTLWRYDEQNHEWKWYGNVQDKAFGDLDKGAEAELFLFHVIQDSGKYKFDVTTLDMDGKPVAQAFSNEWEYTKPGMQLPKIQDQDMSWEEDGTFSCKIPDDPNFLQFVFVVRDAGGKMVGTQFGSPVVDYTIENGVMYFNMNEYLKEAYGAAAGKGFYVFVQATSKDMNVCIDSEWSGAHMFANEPVPDHSSSSGSSSSGSGNGDSSKEEVKVWKPTTPDETKRYGAYSREKVEFSADGKNAYGVTVQNAMQGKLCYDSFESVLDGYTIGRTYNIFPAGQAVYKMDSKAKITLQVPGTLQAANREYRMICVTENGTPVILKDLDKDPSTITFETNVYYAFALVYKDAAAK